MLFLKSHEDLIRAKIGKETAEEEVNILKSDIVLLKDEVVRDMHAKDEMEKNLKDEIEVLK